MQHQPTRGRTSGIYQKDKRLSDSEVLDNSPVFATSGLHGTNMERPGMQEMLKAS